LFTEAGDSVEMDEQIGEIETDKTSLPIVSPASGVIEELFVEDGGRVEKNDQLFKLKLGAGGAPSAPKTEEASAPPPPPPPPSPPPPTQAEEVPKTDVSGPAPTQAPESKVLYYSKS